MSRCIQDCASRGLHGHVNGGTVSLTLSGTYKRITQDGKLLGGDNTQCSHIHTHTIQSGMAILRVMVSLGEKHWSNLSARLGECGKPLNIKQATRGSSKRNEKNHDDDDDDDNSNNNNNSNNKDDDGDMWYSP